MNNYTLKIIAINRETQNASTISFKQPALKKIKYLPGQYLTLTVNINNRKYKRPYSLCSSPGIDSTLDITVKRLPHGIVSNHLLDIVKVGDMLEVMEPIGNFVYDIDKHKGKQLFLWGAGSGITPLMSILKAALQNGEKVNLFYSNRELNDTIFYNQLLQYASKHPQQFSLHLFFTGQQSTIAQYGRISEAHISDALTNIDDTVHYICGPLGLKNTVESQLLLYGLPHSQIILENFENIINESEFVDIKTRFVSFIKGGKALNVEVLKGKSILEAGLDSQIDLPYSCQTGSCTLCKATLVSGAVKKISNEDMDCDINDNERLLCCSYPITDDIIFKID